MTTVRRHSTRRYHAKKQGPMNPNRVKSRNAKRVNKGMKKIHCHQNVGLANLNWENEVVKNKKQRREEKLKKVVDKSSEEEREEQARAILEKNARSVYGWLCTIVANTSRRFAQLGIESSPELSKWQKGKSCLGYILADMMNVDKNLPNGERLKRVHKRVRPTFENVYLPSGEIIEGRTFVLDKLQKMRQQDERFESIMSTSNTTVTVSTTPGATVTQEEQTSFLSGIYDKVSTTMKDAVDTTVTSAKTVAADMGVIDKPASTTSVSTTTMTSPTMGSFTTTSGSASGIL